MSTPVAQRSRAKRIGAAVAGTALLGAGLVALSPAAPAQAISTTTTFSYTGSPQAYAVPNGVTAVSVDVQGAAGANASGGGTGGSGAIITATIPVSPGQTLYAYVGGQSAAIDGGAAGKGVFSKGPAGNGGDSSSIRGGSSALSSLVIAAGGGGGGGTSTKSGAAGGNGGSAAFPTPTNGTAGAGDNSKPTGGAAGIAAAQDPGEGGAAGESGGNNAGNAGGGGGGYLGGGGGGGGTSTGTFGGQNPGGGGGGGAGTNYVLPAATNVFQGSGVTGVGSITINNIAITTETTADSIVNEAFSDQLAATGGTGPYTWSVVGGSSLPAGLTMNSSGLISGTPTTVGLKGTSVQVTDTKGATTQALIAFEITPNGTAVLDSPPTNITYIAALGHATVRTEGTAASNVYCTLAPASGSLNGGKIITALPPTAPALSNTPVDCVLTGLTPGARYQYIVSAVIGGTTYTSGLPQVFSTPPLPGPAPTPGPVPNGKTVATAKIKPPFTVKKKGTTVLLKKSIKANSGQAVKLKLKSSKAKSKTYSVVNGNKGKISVKTKGKKFNLTVTYKAKATSKYTAFKQTFVYNVGTK